MEIKIKEKRGCKTGPFLRAKKTKEKTCLSIGTGSAFSFQETANKYQECLLGLPGLETRGRGTKSAPFALRNAYFALRVSILSSKSTPLGALGLHFGWKTLSKPVLRRNP